MFRLKELRLKKGLNQKEFAKIINVAQNTVSNWENENRQIDSETAIRIADFFGVSTDYLLGRTDTPSKEIECTNSDAPKENVIVYCRNGQTAEVELSKEKMNLVLKMIDALTDEDDSL